MASVNRSIRAMVKAFSTRAYNINTRLLRYIRDPLSFRSLMARTHMVISGSFALQLFDRTHYPDSDLDLYVHPDRSVIIEVGVYLLMEGYTFIPAPWQLPDFLDDVEWLCESIDREPEGREHDEDAQVLYGMKSLRTVYTFERQDAGEVQNAQVIVPRVSPFASILDFHSTCVLNVITYNAAYSLYPYATFEHRESLVINKPSQPRAALAKYSARGWRMLANQAPPPFHGLRAAGPPGSGKPLHPPWFFIDKPRWVCDSKSWAIPLDMTGVVPPPRPSPSSPDLSWDPVAECGWKLACAGPNMEIVLQYSTIITTIFRWKYTAPSNEYIETLAPLFLDAEEAMAYEEVPDGATPDMATDARTWWDAMLPMFRENYLARRPDGRRYFPMTRY